MTLVVLALGTLVFGYWPHGSLVLLAVEAIVIIAAAPRDGAFTQAAIQSRKSFRVRTEAATHSNLPGALIARRRGQAPGAFMPSESLHPQKRLPARRRGAAPESQRLLLQRLVALELHGIGSAALALAGSGTAEVVIANVSVAWAMASAIWSSAPG